MARGRCESVQRCSVQRCPCQKSFGGRHCVGVVGVRFRRPHPAGRYILDLYCSAVRFCIEVKARCGRLCASHRARRPWRLPLHRLQRSPAFPGRDRGGCNQHAHFPLSYTSPIAPQTCR
ncbi:DUF559 domain-containing protein [Sphingomonas sp. ID0503]|uniref:DUF559 domain-containing protein n=1 Tax=Sphingomonas sp. ID0503 TaxID=3399691 RepID=UPI003AFA0B2B